MLSSKICRRARPSPALPADEQHHHSLIPANSTIIISYINLPCFLSIYSLELSTSLTLSFTSFSKASAAFVQNFLDVDNMSQCWRWFPALS